MKITRAEEAAIKTKTSSRMYRDEILSQPHIIQIVEHIDTEIKEAANNRKSTIEVSVLYRIKDEEIEAIMWLLESVGYRVDFHLESMLIQWTNQC
jgi:hypothetical protein